MAFTRNHGTAAAAIGALALQMLGAAALQMTHDADNEAIRYAESAPADSVSALQKRLEAGKAALVYHPKYGYLPAVLKALGIPVSSQILVFSKTSLQRDFISPKTPRAVYFNDDSYIGWTRGGSVLEVSSVDPKLGANFYVIEQRPSAKPKLIRQTHECLQCHDSGMTRGVPGYMLRSVYADIAGQPFFSAGSFITTDQSPLEERWGGWYVTGTHGTQRHMCNQWLRSSDHANNMDLDRGANVTSLSDRFDTAAYLTKHSDIVALMVAEHQARVHNLITRAGYGTRIALTYEATLNKELGRPEGYRSESTLSRIKSVCEPLVEALLLSGEAKLDGRIKGTSTFAAEFQQKGPKDPAARSLRQLDLRTKLFRYPCSFLIYSPQYEGLPAPAKEYVSRRLSEILNGADKSKEFAHLKESDRSAIKEILARTKPGFLATP